MIIGCDLDDVLADFIGTFTSMAYCKFGRPVPETKPADWEWSNFELSKEEIASLWRDIQTTENFWESIAVERGVDRELVQSLDDMHTLYFPTARAHTSGRPVSKQSAKWLNQNFNIQFPTVFVASEKGPMARALKYDCFIDDRPKNCIDIKAALPNCRVYLKNSSHNVSYSAPFNITRVNSFNAFAKIVLKGEL